MTSNNDNDDLIGFKKQTFMKAPVNKRSSHPSETGFELYTFLERESARLDKQIRFQEEKTYMMKNFPQSNSIRLKLETDLSELTQSIITKLKAPKSPVNNSISEVLLNHFHL